MPGLKSSSDFDAALIDLEMEHTAAADALSDLEGRRESVIFDGGDLLALESDIADAQRQVKALDAAISGATKRQAAALEAERQAELEMTADGARKIKAKLTTALIAFGAAAEELTTHACR